MKKLLLLLFILFFVGCTQPVNVTTPAVTVTTPTVSTDPVEGVIPTFVFINIPAIFTPNDGTANVVVQKLIISNTTYVLQNTAAWVAATKSSSPYVLPQIVDSRGNIWHITRIIAPLGVLVNTPTTGTYWDGTNSDTGVRNFYSEIQLTNSTITKIVAINLIGKTYPYLLGLSVIDTTASPIPGFYADSSFVSFSKLNF